MPVISNYLADLFLNISLRGSGWTAISTAYAALYTSNPGKADTGTELSSAGGTAYLRQVLYFGAPSAVSGIETVSITADVTFPVATTDWGSITHFAVKDSATSGAGNLLWYGELTSPVTVNTGERFVLPVDYVIVNLE
jgi:hypothetical protein